ncbi:hypothetical protein [Streptomyces sp. NPDC059894]|uniref:hypothetical protein n=1 Tax=unclassified Streptomyces TaxID=2593676 RepID=UPI00365B68CC
MNVDIDPLIRDTAAQLGAGVPYALKVVARQLADDPDMGVPSDLHGILTVEVDGDLFEDCPALNVGYIREPDRIQIRYVSLARSAEPAADTPREEREQVQAADPAGEAIVVRQVADAWHRITRWLQRDAPDSHAALRAGARPAAVAALEEDLGVAIPVELCTLWMLSAGDDGADGRGCLPGNMALMTPDAVAARYRLMAEAQAVWKATRIPVVAAGPTDSTTGLYLDATTGYLGRWSRYDEAPGEVLDTLVTYLEETADMLEAPALAGRDRPGLIGGTLVWLSSIGPAEEKRWRPVAG